MCRIAAYLGPAAPLSGLLFDSGHSLEHQAYEPREMLSGTVNVDGTGVAWWQGKDPAPLRYVSELPPWTDPNLRGLAPRLRGSPILATVRSATPGIPGGTGAVLPFVTDDIAGSHHGYLTGFRERLVGPLLADLPPDLVGRIETLTDSAALFLLAVAARRDGNDLPRAAVRAVERAGLLCVRAGGEASLNLVLADAEQIVGVRHARGVEPNSLYVREEGDRRWLASEPLDAEPDWKPVPPDNVVRLSAEGIETGPVQALVPDPEDAP